MNSSSFYLTVPYSEEEYRWNLGLNHHLFEFRLSALWPVHLHGRETGLQTCNQLLTSHHKAINIVSLAGSVKFVALTSPRID